MKQLLLLITFASCSSNQYLGPESIDEKISRYQVKKQYMTRVPQFEVMEFQPKAKRGIASTKETTFEQHSNRTLYFVSLYEQYQKMAIQLSEAPTIKSCPSFHTPFLDIQKNAKKISKNNNWNWPTFNTEAMVDQNYRIKNPILNLPMSFDSAEPMLWNIIQKDKNNDYTPMVTKAFEMHIYKTYSELEELCEKGSSDNYYIFENLVGQNGHNSIPIGKEGAQMLLKTTIVSNWYLLSSLEKKNNRNPADQSEFQSEVLSRLNANWFKDYLVEIYQ